MLKKTTVLILVSIIAFSCSNTTKSAKEKAISSITKLEQQCFNDSTNTYNNKIALKTIIEYQKFIEKYPKDSLSAKYLYMSGQLSKSINLYGESIHKFKSLIKKYPNFKKAANAKFLIAMIYENDIKDTTKAKLAYKDFINQYPQSDLVDDAKLSIKYMSLTPEELIKLFEEKNKKDSIR